MASEVFAVLRIQTEEGEMGSPYHGKTIPGYSRGTFRLNDYVTSYNVSTRVEVDITYGLVICERAMYGNNRAWAHDSIGTAAPAPIWYLAEGCTEEGMETYILIQNPWNSDVHVNMAFLTERGEISPPELQGVLIPHNSRRTFVANNYVTSYNVSTRVEAIDGKVVCERAMYGNGHSWATNSIGFAP
jgi:hypothetical protein